MFDYDNEKIGQVPKKKQPMTEIEMLGSQPMILQNFNKMLITEIFQSMRRQPKKDILAGHRSKENSRDHKAPLLKQD